MRYDPETECKVLLAVKERKEATTEELHSFLKDQMELDIEKKVLIRYLRRWKAGKIIAVSYHDGEILWKLADIPPWYVSGIMTIVKGTTDVDMRTAMDGLNEKLKSQGRIIEPRGVWGGYKFYDVTFEAVDPILGGRFSKVDGQLILPRNRQGRFIPSSWIRAWIGTNAALANLPHAVKYHLAVSNSQLPDFKAEHHRLKVKMGIADYEAIPEGTQWTTRIGFPTRGCKLKKKEEWLQFLTLAGETPLRGLGANPFALGGRIKPTQMKQIS